MIPNFRRISPPLGLAIFHCLGAALLIAPTAWGNVSAAAPATQPATEPVAQPALSRVAREHQTRSAWTTTVTAFANALVDETDSATLNELVSDGAIVREFNRSQREDLRELRQKLSGMTVITSRSYLETPVALAGDIATDIKDQDLPEDVKRRLTPADETATKRANVIASKWIASSLFTSGSDPIGVIVLRLDLRPEKSTSTEVNPHEARIDGTAKSGASDSSEPAAHDLLFILLKGEQIDGRFQITQICHGDPIPLAASAPSGTPAANAGS